MAARTSLRSLGTLGRRLGGGSAPASATLATRAALPPLEAILAQADDDHPRDDEGHGHGHGDGSQGGAGALAEGDGAAARPKQVERKVDGLGQAYAVGKRKTSVARIWLRAGSGDITINDKPFAAYFPAEKLRQEVEMPFALTEEGKMDVYCKVKGGGLSGQAGAVQLGISRALQLFDPKYRPILRDEGLLTRDSREVERKKPGKAKARKSFQWVKR